MSKKYIFMTGFFFLLAQALMAKVASPLIEKRQKQLHDIKIQLREAQKRLHEANIREHDVSHQLHKAQVNLHYATDNLNRYSVELRQTGLNLTFTKKRLKGAQGRYEQQKILIANRLNDIYKNGRVPLLDFLLGIKNYSSLLDRLYYVGLIVQQDIDLARAIQRQESRIMTQKAMLSNQYQKIHQVREKVKSEQKVYAKITTEREGLLSEVRQQRQTYAHHVVELEEISVALEHELQELIRREQARNQTVHHFTRFAGSFQWPVGSQMITSSFGWRLHPLFGRQLFHTGVDIGAARGASIHAAGDGIVIYAGWYGGYGQAIVIDHGSGLSTVYAHCSALYVHQGQTVSRGEVIGAVGSTGNATGPHLHFEVRENGTAVDPMGKF